MEQKVTVLSKMCQTQEDKNIAYFFHMMNVVVKKKKDRKERGLLE